jgi:hypothetical protein
VVVVVGQPVTSIQFANLSISWKLYVGTVLLHCTKEPTCILKPPGNKNHPPVVKGWELLIVPELKNPQLEQLYNATL